MSVYSLNNEQPASARSNPSESTSSSSTSKRLQSSITSTQENEPSNVNEKPMKSSTLDENLLSPMKRTSSLSTFKLSEKVSSHQDDVDSGEVMASSSPSSIRRTGSHGKLVNLYGSCKLKFMKL